jgi:hypothetical protein
MGFERCSGVLGALEEANAGGASRGLAVNAGKAGDAVRHAPLLLGVVVAGRGPTWRIYLV